MGLLRNLTAVEIVAQVAVARFTLGLAVTNVVFMGMGEPLDNHDNLVQAIRVMTNFPGLGMKNVTVSTVGLAPQVYSLWLYLPWLHLLHGPTYLDYPRYCSTYYGPIDVTGLLATARTTACTDGLLGALRRRRHALAAHAHQQAGQPTPTPTPTPFPTPTPTPTPNPNPNPSPNPNPNLNLNPNPDPNPKKP